MLRIIIILWIAIFMPSSGNTAEVEDFVRALFAQDIETLDLARTKLEIDRMIDPTINVSARVAELDGMVQVMRSAVRPDAPSSETLDVIRNYIYDGGYWNDNAPFSYDHDDPLGLEIRNKLLSDYLDDRRGNCVSMPILFIILADKMDLNVTASTAPLHVLVRFTDDAGVVHNIEATSGAVPMRDSSYQRQFSITDTAMNNGTYLATLTKEETVAVMASVLVEHLLDVGRYEEAIRTADVILQHYPKFVFLIVKRGTAFYHLLRTEFYEVYPDLTDVPPVMQPRLHELYDQNQQAFAKAEALGWQPQR